MNNFELNSYDIFQTAIQTTTNKKTSLLNDSNAININVSGLNDGEIFQGMICESVISGWESIKKNLDNAINELNLTASTLQSIQNNYQASDTNAEREIGGVI